jgi:hypothetical protein
MGAITLDGVLRAEHDTLKKAVDEWLGTIDDKANEDVAWVMGVNDLASTLVEMLNRGESDGN